MPEEFANLTTVLPFNKPEALEQAFAEDGENIAAIIVEPYPANAGLVFPQDGYLQKLRDITTKYGALLIFDEVMTGFRVAKGGVQELSGVTPDLTALGKVIGGGLPVGAFGGRADIMDYLAPNGPVYQAGTLSGNPLAMAAGIAQLREMKRKNGWAMLEENGAQFEEGVRDALKKHGLDYTFNRVGSMFCLYFRSGEILNVDDVKESNFDQFRRFFWKALDEGVYFAPSPYETGFMSLAHTPDDIDKTIEITALALEAAIG